MPHSKLFVESIARDAFHRFGAGRPAPHIDVKFYPYAGPRHTIRIRAGRVYLRIADIFADAPAEVLQAVIYILVAKILRRSVPSAWRNIYREYANSPRVLRATETVRRARGRKMTGSAQGKVHDLEKMFSRLNQKYFNDTLEKPILRWSKRRTRKILGSHNPQKNTIVISKTLDSKNAPEWLTEFVLYHEMLHIKHPPRVINGRRYYHTKSFRTEERHHPNYNDAQKWLENAAILRRVNNFRAA